MLDLKEYNKKYREGHREKFKEYKKKYYRKNIEKIKERERLWRKENPQKVNETGKRYKIKNPLKRKAHEIVNCAMSRGKLFKQPCVECGELKVEAHHKDYTKPFQITWLCKKHHLEIHNKIFYDTP